MQHRLDRLAVLAAESGVDGVVLNPGPSLQYLIGIPFHLMERPILAFVAPGKPVALALPELECSRLDDCPIPVEAFPYDEDPDNWGVAIERAARSAGLAESSVATDGRWMRMLELDLLRAAAPRAGFSAVPAIFDSLRAQKDEHELELMQRAVRIAEAGLEDALGEIELGMSERRLAGILVENLLRRDADPSLPFAPIVAFGENAANPHAAPGERELRRGDVILVDWGAGHHGYFSDLTRVFSAGPPSDELAGIADIVLRANRAGLAAGKPGVPASVVDDATRHVIEEAGFGERFIHRTGHGLGLEVHEAPYVRPGSQDRLERGMTFTIEPGIYLPGKFGVRIEDDVVVRQSGLESLSQLERKLVSLEV